MYNRIKQYQEQVRSEILQIRKELESLPDGELYIAKSGDVTRLYQALSDKESGIRRRYLNRKERPLAGQLAQKRYLEAKLRDLLEEERGIQSYLRHAERPSGSRRLKLWERSEVFRSLLSSSYQPLSEELSEWASAPYASSVGHPEALKVKAPHGMVRSKSEAMIAWELFENRVPYRYECDLNTPFGVLHPDFTVRHPQNGTLFIWEHFGLMDDPQYVNNSFAKVQTYLKLGYLPSEDLILTYENAESPLDMNYIKMLVRHYFL